MDEAEKKVQEEAEAKAKAEADAKSSSTEEIDYKALAESHEALAVAEKARADAAEALIIKNKSIAKRKDDEGATLTEERVIELIKTTSGKEEDSDEAKKLADAQAKVKEIEAKNTELARALKAKAAVSSDAASAHVDPLKSSDPKLSENSPLKTYKYMGNGVYSKKMSNGKTLFTRSNPGPGEQKTWVE